jgi:hypothetical protein
MELNTELLRWILLIGAAPLWWPFLRTLWRDFDDSLAEEGGVFGRPPGPQELERIQQEKSERPDPLISEPWVRRDATRSRRRSATEAAGPARTPRGFRRRPRKGGFG